jgi:hypothetical protein
MVFSTIYSEFRYSVHKKDLTGAGYPASTPYRGPRLRNRGIGLWPLAVNAPALLGNETRRQFHCK